MFLRELKKSFRIPLAYIYNGLYFSRMHRRGRRAGLSLVEVLLALGVSAVLVSTLVTSRRDSSSEHRELHDRVGLRLEASRILREVSDLLENSARIDVNGNGAFDAGDYPYFWNDGAANTAPHGGFYAYLDPANPAAASQAGPDQEGKGPSREIAFRLPCDVDGLGRSISCVTGRIDRDADTFAIVLVPGPLGNELQLRRYDRTRALVSTRILGREVDRVVFEPLPDESNPVMLGVTVWMRKAGGEKSSCGVRQSCSVTMRVKRP